MFTFASRPLRARIAASLSLAVAAAVVPALALSASAETAQAAALDRPTIVAPVDSTVILKDVVLSWGSVAGATGYKVQVGTDEQWSDDPTYTATSVGTRLALPAWLPHASYVWRVAATGTNTQSRWSSNGTFTRGWRDRPQRRRPRAGEHVVGMPTFRWAPLVERFVVRAPGQHLPDLRRAGTGPNADPPCNPPEPTVAPKPGTVDNNPTQDQQQPKVSHVLHQPHVSTRRSSSAPARSGQPGRVRSASSSRLSAVLASPRT